MGSGGGGGGKTSWPDYMQDQHLIWLNSVDTLIDTGVAAATPYAGVVPYSPTADLTAIGTAISTFDTYIGTFSTTYIAAAITAYLTDVLSDINTLEIPVFEAGMSNINSVQSSSFAIGEALIIAKATKQANKEGAMLYSSAADKVFGGKQAVMNLTAEYRRIAIVAKSEEAAKLLEINIHNATWDLELHSYGGNMLAAMSGGRGMGGIPKPNQTASALGGAMSGAAAGAMIGSSAGVSIGWGTAIGAVVGGVAGYLSAS